VGVTLRTRIAAVASVSVALAVLAAAVALYLAVRSDLRGEVDKGLRERARGIAQILPAREASAGAGGGAPAAGASGAAAGASAAAVPLFGGGPPSGAPKNPGEAGSGNGSHSNAPSTGTGTRPSFPSRVRPAPFGGASGYVEFLAADGAVLVPGGQGSSRAVIAIDASDRTIARTGNGVTLSDRSANGTKLRVITQGLGGAGAVLVARPLTEVDSELSKLLLILGLVGAGGIALAAALGAVVAKVALAPVRSFTAKTERLTAQSASDGDRLDLSQRLEVGGRDELGRLAQSFNRTLDALERSVEAQRQLVADAGHELRTPIASLRANIQVLGEAERLPQHDRASLREDIVQELDELTALVADVIELARGSSPAGERDDVRLDEVVSAALERARRRAGGVSFVSSLQPTVVRGDPARIDRAVSNLLENARKWSPEAGVVEVALRSGQLSVRDHGPGFAEEDLPHVFDRFYRADRARKLPGSGLGLAIVRQAAEACGGRAEAANAPAGGALLTVSFGEPVQIAPEQHPGRTTARGV
jgi:two-component system, OmpR family, sensor histidine kinase MprB